jgi:hypothetical protein
MGSALGVGQARLVDEKVDLEVDERGEVLAAAPRAF